MQEDQCSIAPMLAILYFCLYTLVCTYIMLQLVVGIIVDNIEVAENMETMAINQVITPGCGDHALHWGLSEHARTGTGRLLLVFVSIVNFVNTGSVRARQDAEIINANIFNIVSTVVW
eukprot:scaffold213454_cov20-Tisochrysis_lutea.AAC.1